jgi:hypothetical protein
VDEKATQLHAIASLKVLLDATKPHNGAATTSAANHVTVAQRLENEKNQETQLAGLQEQPNGVASGLEDAAAVDTVSIHNRVTTGNTSRRSRSGSRNSWQLSEYTTLPMNFYFNKTCSVSSSTDFLLILIPMVTL